MTSFAASFPSPLESRIPLGGLLAFALLALWTVGCGPRTEEVNNVDTGPKEPIQVLFVGSADTASAIERFWNAEAASPMEAASVSLAEFTATPAERLSGFDVVVYPSSLLPELAASELLLAIEKRQFEDDDWNQADVLPREKGFVTHWDGDAYGISLGHRPWVLAYRADVLEAVGAEPPRTWQEYRELADRLASPPPGSATRMDGVWQACQEPMAGNWAAHVLLARTGSGIRHRGAYSGLFELGRSEPLLTSPPYAEALTRLVAARPLVDSTPASCFQALVNGSSALALIPLPTQSQVGLRDDEGEAGPQGDTPSAGANEVGPAMGLVRFAVLPGSEEVFVSSREEWRRRDEEESTSVPYLGRPGIVASIVADSRRAGTSWGFLQWLGGRKMQSRLAEVVPGSFPMRYSSLGSLDRWLPEGLSQAAVDDVFEIVRADNAALVAMQPPRYPGSDETLRILAACVERSLGGESPAVSLEQGRAAWLEQIDSIGPERFIEWHEAGLGL